MSKIRTMLRFLKKYALHIGVVVGSIYISICSCNMFVRYENYKFSHELAEFLENKESLPSANSPNHKFINAILSCSSSLNDINEDDSYILNSAKDYIHPFDEIKKFNILKELVLQNMLLNMSSEERNQFIMNHRLLDTHQMFSRFRIEKDDVSIRIVNKNTNKIALSFSLIIKDS